MIKKPTKIDDERDQRVRDLVAERTSELKIPWSDLSKKIGQSHSYIQQFIKRGIPKVLPEKIRPQVAEILSIPESELRGSLDSDAAPLRQIANAKIGSSVGKFTTVPVYGHAVGGKDGQFILNGNKVTDVLAPPSLTGVPDAYAVYVVGDSMTPRYMPGETVFINPHLPVRKGDYVIAQILGDDGEPPAAYVKRFVSMDDKKLRLEQLNPERPFVFDREQVVSVHRIVMSGDA
ncbi:MAG TPA: S24 family peptidase [Xanthobacteraceae bacterium]|nr:S24 family peptidase [Xanthobacteraceae bacterium]